MKTLKEDFEALKNNNKSANWNNPIFRETIVSAFKYCAEKHIRR